MNKTETGGPAFPPSVAIGPGCRLTGQHGMTLRQYAAIKLKVPDSGTDWLDAMIGKSLQDDFAAKAMQMKFKATGDSMELSDMAAHCYQMADAMLEARKCTLN